MSNARTMVEELVYRSCMLLDEKDFKGYLDLCDPEFRYTITAYSPEIKREMTWLEHDKAGIQTLFNNLPRHNSDHSPLTRHVTVYTVTVDDAKKEAQVVSGLQVFKTTLDGGITELFGVGKLYDTVRLNGDSARLLRRNVRLDTRMLGIGYHIPF
ncbi:aromatic-ring-hydroxylating dioxygenase subunit beta [Pelomicrobium sp. G1]|uniref:aromatic-ring-hydroxylating dioxygenase subunit beta n=1 Tax=unclassified Pelomicrobium TaxID=2815318 RepID=UPI0021DED5FC|nr:MAG: hydroxylase [Burkholderiales bacterium]